MRLEQMYPNVLTFSFEELVLKVEQDSAIRADALAQSVGKNHIDEAKVSSEKLSESDKAILKALGLKVKDLKTLKEFANE